MSELQVRWSIKRLCWQASTDSGCNWDDLEADNIADSSEAIDEAAEVYGFATNEWDLVDEGDNQ